MKTKSLSIQDKFGGEGSGHEGHKGIPGHQGGSLPGKGGGSGEGKEVLHGTSSKRIGEIVSEGIKAGKYKNWNESFYRGRENRVFCTTKPYVAESFARTAFLKTGGGEDNKEIVVKAKIPLDVWRKDAQDDEELEVRDMSYMLPEIKKEWITSYREVKTGKEYPIGSQKMESTIEVLVPMPKKWLDEILGETFGVGKISVNDFLEQENNFVGITVDDFLTYSYRRKLTDFEKKVKFAQIEKDLDSQGDELHMNLSHILTRMKKSLLKRSKFIIDKHLTNEIDNLDLTYLPDFRTMIRDYMVKMHLDSKVEALQELGKGGESVEIAIKFQAPISYRWDAVPPMEAMDLFRNKVLAKIVKEDGRKKLLTLVTRDELTYYNARAFAVSGIMREDILGEVKMILLNAISGNQTYQQAEKDLSDVFARYLKRNVTEDNRLRTPHRLETIVRTNLNEAFNLGRMRMFQDEDIKDLVPYYQWSAILDDRTTEYCRSNDEKIFDAKDPLFRQPPAHFNCRSTIVPITKREVDDIVERGETIKVSKFRPPEGPNYFTEEDVEAFWLAPIEIGGWLWIRGNPIPVPKKEWVASKARETARRAKAWWLKKKRKKYEDLLTEVEKMTDEQIKEVVKMEDISVRTVHQPGVIKIKKRKKKRYGEMLIKGDTDRVKAQLTVISKCPLQGCGSSRIRKIRTEEVLNIYKCDNCGATFRFNKDTGRVTVWDAEVKKWMPLLTDPTSTKMLEV